MHCTAFSHISLPSKLSLGFRLMFGASLKYGLLAVPVIIQENRN